MNGCIVRVLLWAGLIVSFSCTLFAQERWVYRYDGPGNDWDVANSIVVGLDGNLYAAGVSSGSGTYNDFTVVSLTASGAERWVYRYDGPGNRGDEARAIFVGLDGNLYAAGESYASGTSRDFTVVSLTTSGAERWVYRYDGSGNDWDVAYSIVMGSDGNLYGAGSSFGNWVSYDDFTVVSLTDSGSERWVYRYDGPANYYDGAYSIAAGSDGDIYAAGYSYGNGTLSDFTVASLTPSGVQRWVYRHDGPSSGDDGAASIIVGSDGNLYVAGWSEGDTMAADFAVVSLDTSGVERWAYRYNSGGNTYDGAASIIMGSDGYLYAIGQSESDFTVVSLDTSGAERWVYRSILGGANSIVMGSDGNLYAAGVSDGDFTIASLDTSGGERWVYRYNGPGNRGDVANSIVGGSNGNLYAAGWSSGLGTSGDFTVLSLTADVGVEEGLNRLPLLDFRLSQNSPNPFQRSTLISYLLAVPAQVTLDIYDITGRLVETLVNEKVESGIHQVHWNRNSNPSGVYFYRLKAGEFVYTKKMVVVE